MARRLPQLNQLRAFEAAARHLSFKDAADELHVTHAAVSHQIKALEEFLGRKLFHRLTRKVRLTEEANLYAAELTGAFDRIAEATSGFVPVGMKGTLRLSVAPFYGNRWLLPRLHRFHERFPDLRVQPMLEIGLVEFGDNQVDAAIRYGLGNWPGLDQIALHDDKIAPVCAPQLVARKKLPLAAGAISEMPLAATSGQVHDWVNWFGAAGLRCQTVTPAVEYGDRALTLDFAIAGNGVALADIRFAQTDILAGHLVQIHPLTIKRPQGMYLVYLKSPHPDPRVLAFGDWILEEVAAG
jgi:LysR family glycine cleavage system transcriptional activator